MEPSARAALSASLRDFRRTWPQLITADLVARILALVVLTPLVGLLLKAFLATTATGVVTDGAIVDFLFHPIGFAAAVIVGAVSLGILFAETGQLMVIGFGALEDRRVTWLAALKYAYRRLPALVELAGHALLRLLLIALPFLAAVGAMYWFGLQKYDIHYYLTDKPPIFKAALVVAGLLFAVTALWILVRIAGWLLALPMVLFEGLGGRQAMRASEEATAKQRRRIVLWLIAWVVVLMLLSALVNFVAGTLSDTLIPRQGETLTLLLVGLSAIMVVSGLAHLAIAIISTVLFPLFVVRVYRALAGPGALQPEIAPAGTLGEKTIWRIPGKTILLGSAVALVLVAAGAYLFVRTLDWQDHCEIIAHRGGADAAPENTLAAFKRGIADGAQWLELDVQENADGVVVVVHDRDFMRVANKNLEVHQATSTELDDMDVGSFFAPEFSDQRVPTLREVLELAKGQAGLFIELKYYGHDRALESKVVDLVEETGMVSDIVIMSLEYDGVRKTAGLRPDWTYGLLNMVAIGDLTQLEVDFLALAANAASYATIHRAHKQGMKVYAWTIDDPVQMSVMMSRGVDGIITDEVARARRVLQVRAQLTPVGRFVIWMAGESGLLQGVKKSSTRDDA